MGSRGSKILTKVTAVILLLAGLALAAGSFRGIVRGYRRLGGVPWVSSLAFAAAALAVIAALRALLAP